LTIDLEDRKIRILKNNDIIEYDILVTFDSMDTMKSYIGYTDGSFSTDGRKKIYFSAYNPIKLCMDLENITDKKEIDMIRNVLNEISREENNNG